VFNDFRNDGIYDASEDFGVSGVQVNTYWDADGNGELSAADGVPVAVATTAVGGEYRFAGLPAGDYIIELDAKNFAETGLLARFVSSLKGTAQRPEPQVDPDDDKDSDDNGYNSSRNGDANVISRAVTLSAGAEPANDGDANASSNLTLDFGVYDPSVGDSVWWDADRDGVQDPGEPGLANVAVNLYADSNGDGELDAGDALRRQATSGSAGDYTFAFLPPGEYLAHVPAQNFAPGGPLEQWNASPGGGDPDDDNNTDSNGAASPMGGISASALTLTSSGEPTNDGDGDEYTNLSLDFGFWPSPAEINGYAWRDSNGDGIQNLGEVPVAGITVTLYSAANELVAATGTGGDGRYRFDALAPGSYYIVFSPPDRFRITAAHSGSDDAIDSDAEAGGQTASIRLTAGREEGHWDIGLLAPTDENERPEPELVPKIFLPVVNR
jgi:hypothetical protein